MNPSVEDYITTARKAQGWEDYSKATEEERRRVILKWQDEDIERLKKDKQVMK